MDWEWWRKMIDVRFLKAEMEFHQHMQAASAALRQMAMQNLKKSLTEERIAELREAIGQLEVDMAQLDTSPVTRIP